MVQFNFIRIDKMIQYHQIPGNIQVGEHRNVYNRLNYIFLRMNGWVYVSSCGNCGADMGYKFIIECIHLKYMVLSIQPIHHTLRVGSYYPYCRDSRVDICMGVDKFTCNSCDIHEKNNNNSEFVFGNTILTRILD